MINIRQILADLDECIASLSACGPAPTNSLGVCTVNGMPVEGKSIMKKPKKKKKLVLESEKMTLEQAIEKYKQLRNNPQHTDGELKDLEELIKELQAEENDKLEPSRS